MKRRIIEIDKEKCNGCGACAKACHEGAIAMTLPHIDAFADTWQLHTGNAMYLAPEKRAKIW